MRRIKNIHITDKQDACLQQGGSLLKYWILAFVAAAWFTRSEEPAKPVTLYRPVAYVTHDMPGQGAGTVAMLGDWVHAILRDGDNE